MAGTLGPDRSNHIQMHIFNSSMGTDTKCQRQVPAINYWKQEIRCKTTGEDNNIVLRTRLGWYGASPKNIHILNIIKHLSSSSSISTSARPGYASLPNYCRLYKEIRSEIKLTANQAVYNTGQIFSIDIAIRRTRGKCFNFEPDFQLYVSCCKVSWLLQHQQVDTGL
jgi:hypothetical protein